MTDVQDAFELTGDHEFTLSEAAEQLGCHRVTLKRLLEAKKVMDTRGKKPTPFVARWRRLPQPHRVFTQGEIDIIRIGMIGLASEKHEDITFEEDRP